MTELGEAESSRQSRSYAKQVGAQTHGYATRGMTGSEKWWVERINKGSDALVKVKGRRDDHLRPSLYDFS